MSYSVTVLLENGRRQRVPVKLSTPILLILEEVCKKHKLKSEEYDLKCHNRILDTTSTVQFCSIPNNVQLELVPATKSRTESPVTIFIQLETGERLSGSFPPSSTLWDVISKLCDENTKSKVNPVIIYTRQEVSGGNLKTTSLRMLGLTGGNALLRLLHRSEDQLRNQCSASIYKIPPKPKAEETARRKPKDGSLKDFENNTTKLEDKKEEKVDVNTTPASSSSTPEPMETSEYEIKEEPKPSTSSTSSSTKVNIDKPSSSKISGADEIIKDSTPFNINDIKFAGERYALIFRTDGIRSPRFDDVPDDFYELTIEDAKTLLRDIRRTRSQLEGSQLETSESRARKKSILLERTVSVYPHCVVRVLFPNRYALQGVFQSTETVLDVVDFVGKFLEQSQLHFYLYLSPPKTIVKLNQSLIDVGGVPGINFYFGGDYVEEYPGGPFFHKRFIEEESHIDVAFKVANHFRQRAGAGSSPQPPPLESSPVITEVDDHDRDLDPSPPLRPPNLRAEPPKKLDGQVPKWFKHQ